MNEDLLIEFLPFDTDLFGIKCARMNINNSSLSKSIIQTALDKSRKGQIEHIVAKVPTEWIAISNILETLNFRLKVCSLDLQKDISEDNPVEDTDIILYQGNMDKQLAEITEEAFSSGTRFHFEEKFSQEKVIEFHRRWISNLIKNENIKIYINLDNQTITSYIAVRSDYKNQKGHIELFAVRKQYRGKGWGTRLINSLNYNLPHMIKSLSTRTESINSRALRTYTKNGFTISRSWSVFHLSF